MTSTPRPDPDPGYRYHRPPRWQPPLQVTRHVYVSIDNTFGPEREEFTLSIGGSNGMRTALSRDDIAALIAALQDPDSWPRRLVIDP